MRDVIAHNYFGIDLNIVWKVIQKNLPLLKKQITELLTELKIQESRKKIKGGKGKTLNSLKKLR